MVLEDIDTSSDRPSKFCAKRICAEAINVTAEVGSSDESGASATGSSTRTATGGDRRTGPCL